MHEWYECSCIFVGGIEKEPLVYGEGGLVDVMSALYPDFDDDDDDWQEDIQEQLEEDGDCDYNDEEVRKLSDETDWSKTWNELEWNNDKQRVSS